jgi:hypothetical protein
VPVSHEARRADGRALDWHRKVCEGCAMELVIAIFTGIGSVLLAFVALRIQHLNDTQVLLWPEPVFRSHGGSSSRSHLIALRVVVGPALGVHYLLRYTDGTWGEDRVGLLEEGNEHDVLMPKVERALAAGESPSELAEAVVWCGSRLSRFRWHAWAVAPGGGDPRSATFWARSRPTHDQVLRRFGFDTTLDERKRGDVVMPSG